LAVGGLLTLAGTSVGGILLFASPASANLVGITFPSCTEVSFYYTLFPANETITSTETVKINGSVVVSKQFVFTTTTDDTQATDVVPITCVTGEVVTATASWTDSEGPGGNKGSQTLSGCGVAVSTTLPKPTTTLPKPTTTLPKPTTTLPKPTTTLAPTPGSTPQVATTTTAPPAPPPTTAPPATTPPTVAPASHALAFTSSPSTSPPTTRTSAPTSALAFTGFNSNLFIALATALIGAGMVVLELAHSRPAQQD
jgi:hypothetical protein